MSTLIGKGVPTQTAGEFPKKNKKKTQCSTRGVCAMQQLWIRTDFWEKGLSVTSGRLAGSPYSPACVNRMLMSAI